MVLLVCPEGRGVPDFVRLLRCVAPTYFVYINKTKSADVIERRKKQ